MSEQRKTTFTSRLGRLLENLNRTSYGSNEVIRNALATAAGEEELDVIGSFKEGASLRSKTTASDWLDYVIGEANPDNVAEKIGRGVASFALDVFTDPLTYVGIGGLTKLGKVAKIATGLKTAEKAIAPSSKIGRLVSKYGDEAMQFETIGTHGLQKSAKEIAQTQAERGQRALLTFMGASVLPKGVNKAVLGFTAQAGHFMRNMPLIKGAIDDAEKLFKTRTGIQPFDEAVQRYKGTLNTLADKHVQVLSKIEQRMKGLKENDFEAVQDYIYGKAGDYNKQVTEVGDELKTFFDDLAKQEQEKGVLKATIDHYMPGIATDEGLKIVKRFADMADKGKSEYAKGLEFAKKKLLTKEMTPSELNRTVQLVVGNDLPVDQIKNELIDTLSAEAKKSLQNIQDVAKMEGIKDVKKFFHTDPAVLARRRAMASATAIAKADFLKEAKNFGMKTVAWRAQADVVKAGWRHVKGVPEFKDMMFPERVAGALERYHKPLTNIPELNKVIKGYKGAIDFWKRWTLSIFPEYHVRNMVGNYWNNYVVAGITDPKIYARAALVMENGLKHPDKLTAMKITTDAGETITGDALWREMQEVNLLNTGIMTHETADHYLKQLKGTPNPATKFREWAQKNGERIENSMKVAHYMTQRMRGMSPMDANLSAKAALFDYCVDEKTEILTNMGWRKYSEITKNEKALTFNTEKDHLEWNKINEIYINNNYTGVMLELTNNRFNACVTPSHRFVKIGGAHGGTTKNKAKYTITEIEKLPKNAKLKIDCGRYNYNKEIYSDDFVKLVAWVLTEGAYSKQGNSIQVYQSEVNMPKVEQIRKIFSKFKKGNTISEYIFKRTPPIYSFYICGETSKLIRKMFPNKALTMEFVFSLSDRQSRMFMQELIKGDGHTRKNGNQSFAQKNEEFKDAFQALAFIAGKRTNAHKSNECYKIDINKKTDIHCEYGSINKRKFAYKGVVWCVTTDNSTIITRRNGKITITGNSELTDFERNVLRYIFPFYSWTKFNLPTQVKGILSEPGKYTTIAKAKEEVEKAQGTQDTPVKWMPEWMRDSFPIIWNQMPTGEQYKVLLLMSWLPAGDIEKVLSGDEFSRFVGSSIEPFSKEVLQQIFGKDFYLEKDIENYPGEMTSMLGMKVPVRVRHALRSIRLLNFVDQLNPGGAFGKEGERKSFAGAERDIIDLSPGEKAFKHIGGIRLYPYDVEKGKTVEKSRLGALTTKMNYQLKSAERKGNIEKVRELRKKIEELEKKKREE